MNKKYKAIAAATLLALVPLTAEMAKQQITVTKCDMSAAMSDADIKYIGGDLFLDSDGNQVQPCKHDNSIYFTIVGQYKDGKTVYNNSKSKPILSSDDKKEKPAEQPKDKPAEEKKLEAPPPKPEEPPKADLYRMTYGNENLEIEDIEAFRQASRAQELQAEAGVKMSEQVSEGVYNALGLHKITDELPSNDKNLIPEEKKDRVKFLFEKMTKDIDELKEKMGHAQLAGAADDMAKNNRIYLSDNNIMNQYPTEQINGISFAIFEGRMATIDFLQETRNIIYELATGSSRTLDGRLAALEYLSEQSIDVCAGQYGAAELEKAKTMLAEPEKMAKTGLAEWGTASQNTQTLYLAAVSAANDKIKEDEYESLPGRLTKGQYQALSDIDKYKYLPETKGNFVNRNVYLKRPLEQVINRARIKS